MKPLLIISFLFFGMLNANHPVSTHNPEVQKLFDQGLNAIYGFNYDLAFMRFKQASEMDPSLAMAYWGMALSLGQNINQDIKYENKTRAYGYIQKALELSKNSPTHEKDYIQALSTRYVKDLNADLIGLRNDYREAMKKLALQYPEDLDATTLYAESILDIDEWDYWNPDGTPKDDTFEVTDLLRSVLIRDPNHRGANHYNIHAWESSPTPEKALMSAFRLTQMDLDEGHLIHMPSHIFILCGYYQEAILSGNKAISADRKYIQKYGVEGDYPLHYLPHNFKMLIHVYMLAGNYEKAMERANEQIQFATPFFKRMPYLTTTTMTPIEINVYFERWKELLEVPMPPKEDSIAIGYWHYARALAYLNLKDMENYEKERSLMPQIALYEHMLNATMGKIKGDSNTYIGNLHQAIAIQDAMNTDDGWFIPIRMELGFAYLEDKQYANAEKAFRKVLKKYQRNGKALEGLLKSLAGQGHTWDAQWVKQEISNSK